MVLGQNPGADGTLSHSWYSLMIIGFEPSLMVQWAEVMGVS